MKKDPRIDKYIDKHAGFAKPVFDHIRSIIHSVCPDVKETIKWGAPAFEFKGPICIFAVFKAHCALAFQKASLIEADIKKDGMGQFGKITSLKDLPSDKILKNYITAAVALNEKGIKRSVTKAVQVQVPTEFQKAMDKNKKANAFFISLTPSKKNDYTSWIAEAKTEATRDKRIATAIEWLLEGKNKNWKYE